MTELLLIFSIFFSGGGVEKIKTPSEIMFHRLGQTESLFIIPQPMADDISPIEASAGEDINTCVGSRVMLTGAGSTDPLGTTLTYNWFFYAKPAGSGAGLYGTKTLNPEFTPDVPGEYYVTIEVKSPDGRTGADTIVVVAQDCGAYPNAVIQAEKTVTRPGELMLSGAGSSCIGDEIISYDWRLMQKPKGSTASIHGSTEAYIVLDKVGKYLVRLTVRTTRGYADSETIELRCIDGLVPAVYAYSQELVLKGVMGDLKKISILIEFPVGMGDLTGVAIYGRTGEKTSLIGTLALQKAEYSFKKVVDYFDDVYIVGMIDEKMVIVKSCTRY